MNEDLNALEIRIDLLKESLYEAQDRLIKLKAQPLSSKYPMRLWPIDLYYTVLFIAGRRIDSKYIMFFCLVETCREWNRIDGFVPDWTNESQKKNVIKCEQVTLNIYSISFTQCPLYFSTRETAQLFLDTFRTEIESVKELI